MAEEHLCFALLLALNDEIFSLEPLMYCDYMDIVILQTWSLLSSYCMAMKSFLMTSIKLFST